MATSGNMRTTAWVAESGSQFSLVFKWSENLQSIENNYTTINWSVEGSALRSDGTGSTGYVMTQNITLKIDNVVIFQHLMEIDGQLELRNGKVLASGTHVISHTANGSKTFTAYLEAGIYNWSPRNSATSNFTLDAIPRAAVLKSVPSKFYDDENPTITYSNPAGNSVTSLQACISLDGTNADIAYRDVSKTGTSYTFPLTTAERNVLRAATTGKNSRSVQFKLRTTIGSTVDSDIEYTTFEIRNPKPTISPEFEDVNDITFALTGDRSKLIRYHSNVKVTIGATAAYGASITDKEVTCGSTKLTADGIIYCVTTNKFIIKVADSRGNTSEYTDPYSNFVNYIKPTCNLSNNMPDGEGNYTLKVTGNYFAGYFGKQNNALNVYYRYKVAGTEWNSANQEWTLIPAYVDGNMYTATASIKLADYTAPYVFQAYAKDVLNTTINSPAERTIKATPVFDWGASDFKFNVPVYDQYDTMFRNGRAAYTGDGSAAIDPNTTLEELCLTSHANAPKGSGTYFFIRTMFYDVKTTTTSRVQIAYPYNKTDSLYYRFYIASNGYWQTWRRITSDNDFLVPATTDDANTTLKRHILTNVNTPVSGVYMYIDTMFNGDPASSTYKTQVAYPYDRVGSTYHRYYNGSKWSAWIKHLTTDDLDTTEYAQIKLLWTNASPSSSFGSQSVDVNLSGYDFVKIDFNIYVDAGNYSDYTVSSSVKVGEKGIVFSNSDTGTEPSSRSFITTTSKVSFGYAYYYTSISGSLKESSGLLRPIRIYGIKGVS